MAQRKETPKKLYPKSDLLSECKCRLCAGVFDKKHCKNLFLVRNKSLLCVAEFVNGGTLANEDGLPKLLCRPCERRLDNFAKFRRIVTETQSSLTSKKRCINESSPSVAMSSIKSSRTSEADGSVGSRRSLSFDTAIDSTLQEIAPYQDASFDEILKRINDELREVARRETNSKLRSRHFEGLSTFSPEQIIDELRTICPATYRILAEMLELNISETRIVPMTLIYGVIMFKRCHELSYFQRINSVILADSGANTEVYERFNKYGICLEKTKKYTIQDEIGTHFLDKVVEEVKAGKTFSFVLDNIDWEEKVHDMRSDHQNKSVHAVATSVVFDRISSSHLQDEEPQQSLAHTDIAKLVGLRDDDLAKQRQAYKMIAAKIMCENIPAFDFIKDLVNSTDQSSMHGDQMKAKSIVVPFPVLLKDEKKYGEIVDVLDQLETWVHKIFAKAGHIPDSDTYNDCSQSHSEDEQHLLLPATTSRPDQPLSHVHPAADPNDPLATVRVPCYGDQLTRVRLAGAKDLRAGCHTARDRLDHIHPIKVADWHCKRSFLKLIFKMLYKNSTRARGTLRYFREKLQRRNVTQDIKHYEDCEQLFLTVGRAYTIVALLQFFGMDDINDSPQIHIPPHDVLHGDGEKQQYFDDVLDKFVDEYLFPAQNNSESGEESEDEDHIDRVREYSLCLLRLFFTLQCVKEAVKLGDGDWLASLRKVLLKHFKSHAGHNTYAIEMLISILQDEVFLTKRQAYQTRWASTVNWKGGAANNIEIDLLQENLNRELKKGIKGMGANKTPQAIERLSRAAGGTAEIISNLTML
ncbi:uncharacterized protein LOC114542053 [Dendronephthya gigantea]|uniref:uncharacterized protein LOC114542053 n=1 Tax=Dendronephthya gigantea TaxID=151771 RepID=UPI00106CF6AC|nr:uncharacterized protein LOC114542053 [Dendronephthya gigantea]